MSPLLHYDTTGQGPTLVLIHGVAGSMIIWDPIISELTKQFRVVRLDLLGYGHSPKPHVDYTPDRHLDAIRATLKHYGVKPPFTIVGLSMGANLVLEYAKRWPDECAGIVAIGMPYYADEAAAYEGLRHNFWTKITIRYPFVAALIIPILWGLGRHGLIPTRLFSGVYTPRVARDALRNTYYAFRSTLLNCMVRYRQDDALQASASKPRLFIQGRNDRWINGAKVAEAVGKFPLSKLVTIPQVGHNTVLAAPAETAKLITDYLAIICP